MKSKTRAKAEAHAFRKRRDRLANWVMREGDVTPGEQLARARLDLGANAGSHGIEGGRYQARRLPRGHRPTRCAAVSAR